MNTITINQVPRYKSMSIARHESNRQYVGHAATDQRIQYILNQSDEDYMNDWNSVAIRENRNAEESNDRTRKTIEERKATGISKKAYREEYDRLNKLYKAGDYSVKAEMKRIQKYAFA